MPVAESEQAEDSLGPDSIVLTAGKVVKTRAHTIIIKDDLANY